MNLLASYAERILIGPEPDTGNETLLTFANGETLTRRAFTESVLAIASVNQGKTTMLRTPMRAMLRDGFGGVVLIVKGSLIDDVIDFARVEGRIDDLIVLRPEGGHVFNPLESETSAAEAAALLAELSEVLAGKKREGQNEAFWQEQLAIILRHLFVICQAAHGRLDVLLAAELFDGRPNTLAEISDPLWQQSSALAQAMSDAAKTVGDSEICDALAYFKRTFPTLGDRLQGSLSATVSTVFDHLRRPPLRDLFTGKSTFSLEDVLERGKICIVGLPALGSTAGRVANALMQFCFCRSVVKQARSNYSFLIADECQELVTAELMQKLAVMREYKVSSFLLTQNLAVLDERIGQTAREGLCGLLGTKIFGPQNHAATRQWASEQIGKHRKKQESHTKGSSSGRSGDGSNRSSTESEHWDYRVPPIKFAELKVGETIVLRENRVWRAKWHRDQPGISGTVRIVP